MLSSPNKNERNHQLVIALLSEFTMVARSKLRIAHV